MDKKDTLVIENRFNQKKINHIFHYLNNFEVLIKILKTGFAPSYCKEVINDYSYYIPMVSFCNIPLRDVDLYMRYGKYGIGLSINWALKNGISPVVYIHEKTPFRDLHARINRIQIMNLTKKMLGDKFKDILEETSEEYDYEEYTSMINEINKITVPTIQFFKYWKTEYKKQEIITYQEREWRYIPEVKNEKRLITKEDKEFELLENKNFREKPHLPKYILPIEKIEDLKYIITQNQKQSTRILNVLMKRFGEKEVTNSILSGNLMIITDELIYNDF